MKYIWTFVNFWGTFDSALRCFVYLFLTSTAFVNGQTIQECGGDIVLNKTWPILSPGYPEYSSPGVECTWKIVSPKRKSVVVEGINLSFGFEIKDDCEKGKLEIFNGCNNSERFLVERICGVRQLTDRQRILWVSSRPCVTIKFYSGQGHKNKFHLVVEEADVSCGDVLRNTNKMNLTFAGSLPTNPGNHNKCVWIIVVHKGIIELVFKDRFQVTSNGKECKDNYVQVQDGRYSTSPLLGKFCGTFRPYPVYSSGRYLRVTLHGSDTGMNLKHSFKAQYNVIDRKPTLQPGLICKDGDIFLDDPGGGTFHTPRYMEQYPADLRCTWKIKVAKNNKITLRFREFDVAGDSQECPDNSDYAKVYNGLASWSPIIGRYCGREIPSSITSKSNLLRIEFQSNTQYAGRGFDAMYIVKNTEEPGV